MHRALFADDARLRIRPRPARMSATIFFWPGMMWKEHVGDHHRADHRADMNECGARAEQMVTAPTRRTSRKRKSARARMSFFFSTRHSRVVDDPAAGDERRR